MLRLHIPSSPVATPKSSDIPFITVYHRRVAFSSNNATEPPRDFSNYFFNAPNQTYVEMVITAHPRPRMRPYPTDIRSRCCLKLHWEGSRLMLVTGSFERIVCHQNSGDNSLERGSPAAVCQLDGLATDSLGDQFLQQIVRPRMGSHKLRTSRRQHFHRFEDGPKMIRR